MYPDGHVTYADTHEQLFEAGGLKAIQKWCIDTDFDWETIDGVKYKHYSNGTITNKDGKFISAKGMLGLKKYAWSIRYKTFTYRGVTYMLYNNGKVITTTGKLISEDGGKGALFRYLKTHTFVEKEFDGITYRIYANGEVSWLTAKGEEEFLFNEGGIDALENYLDELYQDYKINDVYYRIYKNGTVIERESRKLVLSTGGYEALENWIQ